MTSSTPLHNLYHAPLSSYESLDKFNCTAETLKITDDYHQQKQNLINTMNPIPTCEIISTTEREQHKASSPLKQRLQSSQIQSMNNNYKSLNIDVNEAQSKNSSLQRSNNDDYDSIVNADDNEIALNKQKHLSDWYYIKTSPKPKPTSPYERRKVKNLHPPMKSPLQPFISSNESYNNRNSTDKISSLRDESQFIPLQKYRSNDYIVQNNHHFPEDDKSPLQTHKCFSMKYSKNPSGNETKFGEMTSSSFEHVNVTGLYENRFSENDLRSDDYVHSLRMAAAKMRPLPQAPTINKQESQVCRASKANEAKTWKIVSLMFERFHENCFYLVNEGKDSKMQLPFECKSF